MTLSDLKALLEKTKDIPSVAALMALHNHAEALIECASELRNVLTNFDADVFKEARAALRNLEAVK